MLNAPVLEAIATEETSDKVEYWALIVCGDDFGYCYNFGADAAYMYHVLREHYCFDDDHIYYLHVDTTAPGVDDLATKAKFRWAITDWLANRSDENDIIFIYFTNHGGGCSDDEQALKGGRYEVGSESDEGTEHYINDTWWGVDECLYLYGAGTPPEEYWDDELADDIDYLDSQNKYGKLIFACLACYSGGLIDDISAENRIIMTAANETHTASRIGEDNFSPWSDAFIDALHGEDAYWDLYERLAVHKGIPVDADFNDDGNVSMKEAWDYAWEHGEARLNGSETDWLDDNGNGHPTYINGSDIDSPFDPNDGTLAASTWLPKAWIIDINRDGIIDIFDLVRVARAYGSKPQDPNWYAIADVNDDYIVDIFDLVAIAAHYGESRSSSSTSSSRSSTNSPVVSVYPDEVTVYRHESFSVNVTVTDVTDLYGWEFKFYWNSTILNCTSAQIHAPDIWGENVFEAGDGIQNDFNATHGRYFKAMSALYPTSSFNGSMALVTLTFEAKAAGSSTLDLEDTKLSDSQACAITHTTADGSVAVLSQTRYMRGDKHTVNNLEAYKLDTSQSVTQNTYSDAASGIKTVYWGIRVWKRNTNGTETEITGGTPVAQVSRSANGEGMQSSIWSCPQTSLQETDAIVVRVYTKFGSSSWKLCSTFITEQLEAAQLDPSQWTVHYYTWRYYASYEKTTYGFFKWGTPTHNSRIANFEYT